MRPEERQHHYSEAMEAEEGALLHRIAAHDRCAFDALYLRYRWRLLRFIGQLVPGAHLLEEILNDTMLVVWHKAASYNGHSRVSTWIFAIAYREVLRARKRDYRARRLQPSAESTAWSPSLESDFIEDEARAKLHHIVAQLSDEQRAVVELTYFHGLGYKEIAQALHCPLNTVKTRMFHARRRLKALLTLSAED